jgi:hypothetical protein
MDVDVDAQQEAQRLQLQVTRPLPVLRTTTHNCSEKTERSDKLYLG